MRKSLWLWVLLVFLVILVLGLIFGGYRKGTKLGAPAEPVPVAAWSSDAALQAAGHSWQRLVPRLRRCCS
ncbi:hypothetical protein QRX60_42875 [Amycolatopsis mongoliensis]|uniref:Uncharacterized protein n=1 Tax=Amycolatopsis mongoliensis TaxID=715475 RepID=A0A9Y2NGF3_9PSEU|nr:hypothetical protein [Amycolatopsis sp. 4-36]WIY00734.1 hypothetical protein QRX60_42875 [Amycolatopsis sp. 4-36]